MAGTHSWLKIPVTGGTTIINITSLPLLNSRKWHLNSNGYAVNRGGNPKRTLRLHRLIAATPPELTCDHINRNRTDNRLANLRNVIAAYNSKNTDRGKGYCWDASKQKWMVRVNRKFCGRYRTEQEAINAVKRYRSGEPYLTKRRKLYFLPLGVTKQFGKYGVRPRFQGKRYWLGQFATIDEAVNALNLWHERMV